MMRFTSEVPRRSRLPDVRFGGYPFTPLIPGGAGRGLAVDPPALPETLPDEFGLQVPLGASPVA